LPLRLGRLRSRREMHQFLMTPSHTESDGQSFALTISTSIRGLGPARLLEVNGTHLILR
jgi:hypothetical protein